MSAKEQIKQLVDYFKREPYLKDKTDAMGDGLMLGASLADESNERSKAAEDTTKRTEDKYKEQILAQDLNPNKDPELVDLRNGNATAGERITKFEQETTAQFQQTENEVYVTSFMSKEEINDIKLKNPLLDHSASIQAYVDKMLSEQNYGLHFPAGNFRFKNINLGDKSWIIKGSRSGSGYVQQTKFIVISEANSKGFYGSNRQISFIDISSKSEGTKKDGKNVGFYENLIVSGAFISVSNMLTEHFSGDVFKGVDLIDSEFYRLRVLNNANVFNFKTKSWIRSTTITFNKVYGEGNDQIFDVPDCSQSKIVDCIFEHGGQVGNITNGSWTIDNLYLENNTGDLDATNSLLVQLYIYSFKGGKILNTQPNVTPVDKGYSRITHKGLKASEISVDVKRQPTVLTGDYETQTWVKIGRWESASNGGRLKINIIGTSNWGQDPDGAYGHVGETTINLLHGANTDPEKTNAIGFAYHTGGNKPVSKVKVVAVEPSYRDKFDIYVLIAGYARYIGIDYDIVEGIYIPEVKTKVPDPGLASKNILDVPFQFRIETSTGAFNVGEDGKIRLTAPVTTGGSIGTTAKNYLPININGSEFKIPLL